MSNNRFAKHLAAIGIHGIFSSENSLIAVYAGALLLALEFIVNLWWEFKTR